MTTDPKHSIRHHAICSASSAYRWIQCSGSVALNKDLPRVDSIHAIEGTVAHEYAESILRNWLEGTPVMNFTDCPEEMEEAVQRYIKFVKEKTKEYDHKPTIRIESKLSLKEDFDMWGTADIAMTGIKDGKSHGKIIDLKYGKTKVIAKNNPQLAYYGAALINTSKRPLDTVEVVIYQPRIDVPATSVTYENKDLRVWEAVLTGAAERALRQLIGTDEKSFNRGDWCKWCNAKKICPAMKDAEVNGEALEFMENL